MQFYLLLSILLTVFAGVCQGIAPNIPCMLVHCRRQSLACMGDHDCRAMLSCITKCQQNSQSCTFNCLYSYENKIFDTFMRCASTNNNCVKLDPPNPRVVCNKPSQVVQSFSLSDLEGTWYTVKGMNSLYDCFDCRVTKFTRDQSSNNVMRVNDTFDVHTIEGSIKHRSVDEKVTQMGNSGILQYSSTQLGHDTVSEWRVLDYGQNGDYILMYYCGSITADYFYEGSVVYSKTPSLNQQVLNNIETKAASLGYSFSSYCSPKTAGCSTR